MKKMIFFFLTFCIAGASSAQNGLHFDGTNDFVQTTYPGVSGSANRTFEAWVNVSQSAPASNLAILDYGVNIAGSRNTFVVSGSRSLGFLSGGTNANLFSPAGAVPVGQWVHVAFVLNGGTGFLYVNGTQVATGNLSSVNTPSGNQNLKIGQRVSGGSILFNGSIDEVRIWNVARTAAELNAFQNVEICNNPTNLVAYYKMNEGVAGGSNLGITTTLDEIAGNNGQLNSFAMTGATSNFVTGATLTSSYSSSQILDGCPGFTVTVGGNTYDSTGVYVDTLAAALTGCDSIVSTDLTINATDSTTQTFNECTGFSVTVGSNIYNSTGIFVDTLSSILSGCDSIVTTELTIDTVNNTTTASSNTITAVQNGAAYAWIDCDNGNALIPGETSQSYSPAQNGNYAVIVTNGACVDTSACVSITVVGVENGSNNWVKLYPNPVKEILSIELVGSNPASIAVFNVAGQKYISIEELSGSSRIDVANLASGLYFVETRQNGKVLRQKFIKL